MREAQVWMWWTLGSSKVRRTHADDINGDEKPELLLGVGHMRLHCLDNRGEEPWRFRTDHGICTTITTSDGFGEGQRRVLAGNGLTSSNGTCWVLDEEGNVLQKYYMDPGARVCRPSPWAIRTATVRTPSCGGTTGVMPGLARACAARPSRCGPAISLAPSAH